MLDRPATLSVAVPEQASTLTRRRAAFAILVATTMAAVLWLASVALPPPPFAAETSRFDAFIAKWGGIIPVTYRRRAVNTAFKAGNIRDFCERWGNNHSFALSLDADSFMPAHAVLRLIRIMQANPTLGILQTL